MDISNIDSKVEHLSRLRSQYKELREAILQLEKIPIETLTITCPPNGGPQYSGRLIQDLGLDKESVYAVSKIIMVAINERKQEIEDYFEKYLGGMPDEQ